MQEIRNVHVEYECEVQKIYERKEFVEVGLKETIFENGGMFVGSINYEMPNEIRNIYMLKNANLCVSADFLLNI